MQDDIIFSVSVPATSANVGVGYDCLGLAFNLRAHFTFRKADELEIDGCPSRFQNDDNLVWQAYCTACDKLGDEPTPKHITIDSPIPFSGGLGSSSTCVIAGVACALQESHSGWDPERALDLACRIEGHPDNVAPAIYGGLTSSFVEGGHTVCSRIKIARGFSFVAIAPPYSVQTEDARLAMPSEVPIETAVWQMGRVVAVTNALATGNAGLLSTACVDKLHEPYRKKLIPDYDALREAARMARASAFVISGSGAAMIAICESPIVAQAVMNNARDVRDDLWIQILEPSLAGTSITCDDNTIHHNTFDEI